MSEQSCYRKRFAYQNNATLMYFIYRRITRAQQDGRHVFETINRVEPVVEFKPGHVGQAIIKNEEMRRKCHNGFDGVAGGQMMERAMGGLLVNDLDKELTDIRIIFDDENKFMRREVHIFPFPVALMSRKPRHRQVYQEYAA